MATRPIYIPLKSGSPGVQEKPIDFKWHSGFAKGQKQKSIAELHQQAKKLGYKKILEISSKSENEVGVKLSAFNLRFTPPGKRALTVETAFQGSKVFSSGGPYTDLYGIDSLSAKRDRRLRESGSLTNFDFFGELFSLEPTTLFYNWLYINALVQNRELAIETLKFDGFSDIEFNPKKSINCQAYAVAMYVSLIHEKKLDNALESPKMFHSILYL